MFFCSPALCTCPHSPCSGRVLEAGQCRDISFQQHISQNLHLHHLYLRDEYGQIVLDKRVGVDDNLHTTIIIIKTANLVACLSYNWQYAFKKLRDDLIKVLAKKLPGERESPQMVHF